MGQVGAIVFGLLEAVFFMKPDTPTGVNFLGSSIERKQKQNKMYIRKSTLKKYLKTSEFCVMVCDTNSLIITKSECDKKYMRLRSGCVHVVELMRFKGPFEQKNILSGLSLYLKIHHIQKASLLKCNYFFPGS